MPRPTRWTGRAALAGGAALPWAWFAFRDLSATFDGIAFFLPAIVLVAAVAIAVVAVAKRQPALAVVVASLVVFGAVVVLQPRTPSGGPAPVDGIHLVSANAFERNPSPAEGARDLLARHPDVLVVVEATVPFRDNLVPAFAFRIDQGRNTVFSRWPLSILPNPEDIPDAEVIRVQVAAPSGPFVLYAIHADNPLRDTSFGEALDLVERLASAAGGEQLPVVLAGDFNETDRSQAYRVLDSGFRDAMRTRWAASTYDHGIFSLLQLRIDHVFTSEAWCAANGRTFSVAGSDHEALEIDVGPCPVATPAS